MKTKKKKLNPFKAARRTWDIKPVTKVKESKKKYNRKREAGGRSEF